MNKSTELSKLDNVSNIIDAVIEGVKQGDIPALPSYVKSKRLSKHLDRMDKEIKETAIEEAERYREGEGFVDGIYWSHKKGGGRYNYKHYELWRELKAQEDKMAQLRKNLEEKMKAAYKTGSTIIDEETGEVIPPATFKANSDSISVK